VTLQRCAAAFGCRAAEAALWRFDGFSVESPLMSEQTNKNEDQPKLDELISLSEAAELSGFTTRHLRYLAESGDLWARKLGHNWFTTAQAVKDYLARERRPGPKPQKSLHNQEKD
jgi:hypothetical protein